MKNLLFLITFFLLIFGGMFIVSEKITGFITYNESVINKTINLSEITRQDALNAINQSEETIKLMQEKNFSVIYLKDLLIEANQIFQQAEYADILRNRYNHSSIEVQRAEYAMKLIRWQEIYYGNVLNYTNKILDTKIIAFWISDRIDANSIKIDSFSDSSKTIFEQVKLAFSEERYNDAQKLLEDLRIQIEKDKSQSSFLIGIRDGTIEFILKYWIEILAVIILFGIAGYFEYRKMMKTNLRNKIKKMKLEEQVIEELKRKTQTERFEENKISGLVYNIRMKKYDERLQEIAEKIPVFEEKLKKFKNKSSVDKSEKRVNENKKS